MGFAVFKDHEAENQSCDCDVDWPSRSKEKIYDPRHPLLCSFPSYPTTLVYLNQENAVSHEGVRVKTKLTSVFQVLTD